MVWLIVALSIILIFAVFTKLSTVKLDDQARYAEFIKNLKIINEAKYRAGDYGKEDYDYFKKYIDDNFYDIYNALIELTHPFVLKSNGYILKKELSYLHNLWENTAWPTIAYSRYTENNFKKDYKEYLKLFINEMSAGAQPTLHSEKIFFIKVKPILQHIVNYNY